MAIRPCVAKISISHNFIFVFYKNSIFTQKWNFFMQVDILISCPPLSSVLHNSTQKLWKIRHLVKGTRLMLDDLHFLILTCLHKIQSCSWRLSSEAISIDELGLISPQLHTYTTFFLLNDVVWWGFDWKCHRYLKALLWMFPFFWRTDWKCIKCDVIGK